MRDNLRARGGDERRRTQASEDVTRLSDLLREELRLLRELIRNPEAAESIRLSPETMKVLRAEAHPILPTDPICSFCERPKSDGERQFFFGPSDVFICQWCVELCADVLQDEREGN
jgi:hypothetical protein